MENYEFEARFFAANGIASLLFDKSGNGKSKGPINFQFQSFEDKNKQYMALFQYLKSHAKTDPQKIGVHGPSEGGRLSLMMAIDLGNEVAFVNAVAAPLMTMREGQFYAMSNHHRDLGVTEKQNTEIQLIWDDYYNGIIKGEISSETIDKANGYREINQRMFLPPNNTQLPAAPHKDDLNNDRVVKEAGK